MSGLKISKEDIVNNIIKSYPETIGVFSDFHIDSCCGGAVSIEEASRRDKANLEKLLEQLNKIANRKEN